MPGDDDDFVERNDRGELLDDDDAVRRREQVTTIQHECADAENRKCDEGADHSMNPEHPAVHNPVLISGRGYHFDPAHPERVGLGSHIKGPVAQSAPLAPPGGRLLRALAVILRIEALEVTDRSEEHTSELQSP